MHLGDQWSVGEIVSANPRASTSAAGRPGLTAKNGHRDRRNVQSPNLKSGEKSAQWHFDGVAGQLDHATFGYFDVRHVDVPFEPEVGAERRVWAISPDARPHLTLSKLTAALRVDSDDLPCSAQESRLPEALK